MNATSFFSEEQFHSLKRDVAQKKVIDIFNTTYGKKVKVNGNHYSLRITTGYLKVGNCEYYVSLWHDFNYKGKRTDREIGGGCGGSVNLESYDAFCAGLNKRLMKFPDYTEPTHYYEQMSLF